MPTLHMLSVAVAALLLSACATPAPSHRSGTAIIETARAPSTSVIAQADDNLNAVAWTQTAVEHDLIILQVYRDASDKLLKALADRDWDALPRHDRTRAAGDLKPAVILDVDETVLDNSTYQARLIRDHDSFDPSSWAQWCRERVARPLPGALEFARLAAAKGVTVFYLSNRAQDLEQATLDNLRSAGFPLATNERVFLGLGTVVDGCKQIGSDKGCRRELIGGQHRVLLQIGDQLGDFVDVPSNTPAGRQAAIAPYMDWIGERWFVLPNPTYGSWESALFNSNGSGPASQRRQAKLEALRY